MVSDTSRQIPTKSEDINNAEQAFMAKEIIYPFRTHIIKMSYL